MKIAIVYDTKTKNTAACAAWIVEGLLAYARETGDEPEIARLTKELVAIVSQ